MANESAEPTSSADKGHAAVEEEGFVRAWLGIARPPRRSFDAGPNQLSFGGEESPETEAGVQADSWCCGVPGCNRAPGHRGPHRTYDRRTFGVLKEWD